MIMDKTMKRDIAILSDMVENQGLEYSLINYSEWESIDDEAFHKLRKEFTNICSQLEQKIDDLYRNSQVVSNKIQCVLCEDIVESKHRHDLVWCKCGECYVDGGLEYQRVGYKNHPPKRL